ncbi:MAG: tetratricopeptide repeat protein [Gammaproteobacteria bacterium]|nr:tetratricopeptide repeat protein [Gammaproteobacteria bacterium]MBU1653317.1 tetratricopeptide repeat protein [Gammaproteobacteria bacterium]MBU1961071.1 tetratricopeptide repeat protein [Gammaproteobacteria bacterium]
MLRQLLIHCLLLFLTTACALPFRELDPEPEPVQGKIAGNGPYPTPEPLHRELTSEIIFQLLAGELAAHRGRGKIAFGHYRKAATLSGDPGVAERTAKIALFLKDKQGAEASVAHWVQRDPNNLEARQFAVAVALYVNKFEQARGHLADLVRVADAKGEDGFLLAVRALGKAEDAKQSLNLMRGLVKVHRSRPESWHALALLAAEIKAFSQAKKAIARAVVLKPDWREARVLQSKIFWFGGHRDEALGLMGKLVVEAPDDKDLRQTYARFLVQAERHKEAFGQFQELLKEFKDQEQGHVADEVRYALGILALQLKRHEESVAYFEALLNSPQRRSEAAYFLGRIAEERKDDPGAIKWYESVTEGEYELEASLRIAERLSGSGRLAEARARLTAGRGRWPEHAVRIYVLETALLKEAKADEQEVWKLFDEALKGHPKDADLLYSRALYGVSCGRVDVLERDLQAVLKDNPKHADALNALGYTLSDMTGRQEEAMGYIRQALELKPDSPAILDSMGWVQYRIGRLDEALGYLHKANEKLHDPEIASHLGEVLWVSGKKDEARQVWKKAWEKFADNDILQKTLERFGVEF